MPIVPDGISTFDIASIVKQAVFSAPDYKSYFNILLNDGPVGNGVNIVFFNKIDSISTETDQRQRWDLMLNRELGQSLNRMEGKDSKYAKYHIGSQKIRVLPYSIP